MLAWHLGLRYLRKRRAAWLALAAITLTVAAPVTVIGVTQGFLDMLSRQARSSESDVTLEDPWGRQGVPRIPELIAEVESTPGVRGQAPFVHLYALASPRGSGGAVPCQVDGVDWTADARIGRLDASLLHPRPAVNLSAPPLEADERGSGFLTRSWREHVVMTGLAMGPSLGLGPAPLPPILRPPPGVVAGRELLYSHPLSLRQRLDLVGASLTRQPIEISDTVGTGILEVDRTTLIVPLPVAQALAGYTAQAKRPARVDGFRVQSQPGADLGEVSRVLKERTGLWATTWEQRRASEVKSLQWQRNIMAVVMLAIQTITVFVVYAVFSTLVAEKRHDIGVLLGIGARRSQIASAFLISGIAACVVGGLLGWAVGWGLLLVLKILSERFGLLIFPQDVFYSPQTPISWDPLIPLFFIGAMTAIGLLAVAIPAWRASRIEPVDILREGG